MIPEGFATLYAFLGLVAPGLLYQLLSERRRPALVESGFREASRVALTSLSFTTASVAILALLSLLFPQLLPDLSRWMREGETYAKDHFWLIVIGLALEVALACLIVLGFDALKGRSDKAAHPVVRGDIWNRVLFSEVDEDKVAWIKVELNNGEHFWGYVDYASIGESPSDREIVLKGPNMQRRSVGKYAKPVKDAYWTYVMIKYSDIRVLKVRYEPRAKV